MSDDDAGVRGPLPWQHHTLCQDRTLGSLALGESPRQYRTSRGICSTSTGHRAAYAMPVPDIARVYQYQASGRALTAAEAREEGGDAEEEEDSEEDSTRGVEPGHVQHWRSALHSWCTADRSVSTVSLRQYSVLPYSVRRLQYGVLQYCRTRTRAELIPGSANGSRPMTENASI
eukprot:3880108-Rhodomonas_salina.3